MEIERGELKVDERNIKFKSLVSMGNFGSLHRGVYRNGEETIDVAVKVYNWGEERKEAAETTSSRKGFEREISVLHNLKHPNIAKMIGAKYYKAGHHIGVIQRIESKGLIMMEYIPRALSLKSHVSRHVKKKLDFDLVLKLALKLDFDLVLKLALGLARGLSYLHSKKIIHRDVRLENVFLDKQRNVKLMNFKSACFEHDSNQNDYLRIENNFYENRVAADTIDSRVSSPKDASKRQTVTDVLRRLGYMAPEVRKKIPYDHKCDVYSFGLCLWEIYCCDDPFPRLDYYHQNVAYMYEYPRPRIPKCCPKSLGMIIVKCWDSDPNRRPEMREVVRMLEDIDVSECKGMSRVTGYGPLSLLSCIWGR